MYINIGTIEGNIVKHKIDKDDLKDVTYKVVREIVDNLKSSKASIYGWCQIDNVDEISDKNDF